MPRQNRTVTLNWDSEARRLLSLIAPQDADLARIWWQQYAPGVYQALLDSKIIEDIGDVNDEEELARLLNDVLLDNDSQRRWYAAGLLLFFIGGHYWRTNGRRVAWSLIRGSLDRTILNSGASVQGLCDQLRSGAVSLENWQSQMAGLIRVTHLASAMAAAGGSGGMTPDLMQLTQQRIESQLEFLQNFASRIAGGMPLDGNICRVMLMYINAGRGTFHAVEAELLGAQGFIEYRNVLGATEDHCTGSGSCLEVSGQGWQPVGSLPEIGNRKCMSNCLCSWQYRNPFTGEVR